MVANDESSTVSIFPGNGNGTLGARRDLPAGSGTDAIAVADLNGDGRLDLATGNGVAQTITVFLNQGSDDFAAAVGYPIVVGWPLLVAGDLNGDGHPDLVVSDFEGTKVLLNHGDGSFAPARRYPLPATRARRPERRRRARSLTSGVTT